MKMEPCKHLDYGPNYPSCALKTCAPTYPDVRYWERPHVPYKGAPVKVQFCRKKGRINGIFDCYGERPCFEPYDKEKE